MANEDRIVQRISLEGAEDVQKKLQAVGAVGKDALKNVSTYTADASSGIGRFASTLGALGSQGAAGNRVLDKFRESIHVLHPILETAGLGMGNLGAFSRVAGIGLGALGVAIAGSIVAGLAKLADSAQAAKTRITDLGDPKLYERAREQANKLGIDVGTILPAVEQGQIARRGVLQHAGIVTAPGSEAGPLNASQNVAAVGTIAQALRAGGATTEEAGQGVTRFFTQLQEQGRLTVQSVEDLARVAPRAADALAKSFGTGLTNYQQLEQAISRGQITDGIEQIYRNLERFGVSDAFKQQAEDARPFEAALDRLASKLKDLWQGRSGEGGVNKPAAGALDLITGTIDSTAKAVDLLKGNTKLGGGRESHIIKIIKSLMDNSGAGEADAGLYQAAGGHIRGAGTSTSDSIPAMLSNGEYVINAKAVDRYGVGFMEAVNRGYAFGGVVKLASGGKSNGNDALGALGLGIGNYSVTYDPTSGGAIVNGVLRMPGDPLLDNPTIKAALERSKAGMKGSSGKAHGVGFDSWGGFGDFTGNFGGGEGFAAGGLVGRLLPHFADGGAVHAMSSLGASGGAGSLHPVVINFANGGSVGGLHAEPSALKQLTREAVSRKAFSVFSNSAPSWMR